MWNIYFNALDHPGLYVVRGFTVGAGTLRPDGFCLVFESLELAREAVPAGLACLSASVDDEPQIVETWF